MSSGIYKMTAIRVILRAIHDLRKGTLILNNVWQEEFIVKSSDTDFQRNLKLSNFFTYMQDVASNHATNLGVGYYHMIQKEMAWVLSRKKVSIFDFPQMNDRVIVQTWPKGIQQKLFFMRDHRLAGADGRLLAVSTSAYVLVNTRARRILLPNALEVPVPDNDGKSAIDEPLEKITATDNLSECFSVRAGYSMVDLMGHVNNARYIDWICDCFLVEDYQARRPIQLQINFLNEVKPGELVTLLRGERSGQAGCWYITGMNQANGTKAFEAEILWK
jgi:medium-chain acyl-[acyl-carrier-protein] hydrolase